MVICNFIGQRNKYHKNTEAILDASEEVGVEVNAEKSKVTSHHQTARQNHYMKVTIQNCIHGKIKSKLNLGSACYHAVENPLPFCLLYNNARIKTHKTVWV